MRALLIDPAEGSVAEVQVKADGDVFTQLRSVNELVGGPIELVYRLPNGDVLLVDEAGRLKQPSHFFWYRGFHGNPIAGRCVVVGEEDGDGDITPARSLVAEILDAVQFSRETTP